MVLSRYTTIFFDLRVGDNLNIKVADFGLARDVYIKEYYRQQSIGKVPVRWMAPEALHDKISNEKTDVVSHQQLATLLHWKMIKMTQNYCTCNNKNVLRTSINYLHLHYGLWTY